MSEEKVFSSWQEVIVDFLQKRKDDKIISLLKTKLLKEKDKGLIGLLIKSLQGQNKANEIEEFQKLKKTKEQSELEFQLDRLERIKKIVGNNLGIDHIEDYKKKVEEITKNHEPNQWMHDNVSNFDQVGVGTHVAKLTHSSSKGSSFFDNTIQVQNSSYLTTSNLKLHKLNIDGFYTDAKYSPNASFLLLEFQGSYIYELIIKNDFSFLSGFDKSNPLNERSKCERSKCLREGVYKSELKTHSLGKQIYFPTQNSNYHLLCNVRSSSMAHSIFEILKDINTNDDSTKKYRENKKYSESIHKSFSGQSKLSITKSNHSNSSQLNGKRGGKINLFSTQPPSWQAQLKPPIYKKSVFDSYSYPTSTNENLWYLVSYILRLEGLDLSTRDPEKQQRFKDSVSSIVDDFFDYVSNIHTLEPGWSSAKGVRLKIEHRYLLDPFQDNKEFQAKRKEIDWQSEIVNYFSNWLNRQLKRKNKAFAAQKEYSRIWKEVMEIALRDFEQTIEAVVAKEVKL